MSILNNYFYRLVRRVKPFIIKLRFYKIVSDERYNKIILGGITNLGARSIGIISSFITIPLALNYLGLERYGLWITMSSILALMNFADLGIGNGLVNLIAEANGKDNRKIATVYVSSAFLLLLGISLLLLIILFCVYPFVPWARVYNLKTVLAINEAGPATAVFYLSVAINIPLGSINKIQLGYQEGAISNFWIAVGAVLGLGFILSAIYAEVKLPWLVAAMSAGPVIANMLNWSTYFYRKKWLFPRINLFNWKACRKVAGIGSLFLILQMAALIGNSSDSIVITQVLGATAVAGYAVTQKLFTITLLMQYFSIFFWPAFGEALARGDYLWVKRGLNYALLAGIILSLATAVPLFFFGKQVILLWVGKSVVPSDFLLLGFTFWALLAGYGGVMSTFLNSGKLLVYQTWFYVLSSVVALVLKIVLVANWDVAGAIWATVLGYGIFYVIPSARLAYGSLNKKLAENNT